MIPIPREAPQCVSTRDRRALGSWLHGPVCYSPRLRLLCQTNSSVAACHVYMLGPCQVFGHTRFLATNLCICWKLHVETRLLGIAGAYDARAGLRCLAPRWHGCDGQIVADGRACFPKLTPSRRSGGQPGSGRTGPLHRIPQRNDLPPPNANFAEQGIRHVDARQPAQFALAHAPTVGGRGIVLVVEMVAPMRDV